VEEWPAISYQFSVIRKPSISIFSAKQGRQLCGFRLDRYVQVWGNPQFNLIDGSPVDSLTAIAVSRGRRLFRGPDLGLAPCLYGTAASLVASSFGDTTIPFDLCAHHSAARLSLFEWFRKAEASALTPINPCQYCELHYLFRVRARGYSCDNFLYRDIIPLVKRRAYGVTRNPYYDNALFSTGSHLLLAQPRQ
jgi:hypothetical protein